MITPTTIYVLVARLDADLRDDIEYASADSFIAAYADLPTAMDAAHAKIAADALFGIDEVYEILECVVHTSIQEETKRTSVATFVPED